MGLVRLATSVGLLFALAIATIPVGGVNGQSGNTKGLTVSPSFKEIIIGTGLIEASTTVSVRNDTGTDLTAQIRLVDFSALDEFGGVSLGHVGAPLDEYSLAGWMNLPNGDTVSLPNGQNVDVPITIRNDDELSPGGHYGAAIFSVVNEGSSGANQLSFKQEVASLLFIKKTGGETYGLELESMQAENVSSTPESINLKFKSTGNTHVVPRGYIEVKDPDGKLVAKGIINPESTLVLPETSRQFTTTLQQVAESKLKGEYTVTAYYRYDGMEDFNARSINYTNGNKYVSTGIILLVVVLITGVVYWLIRNKHNIKSRFRR